MAFHFNKLSIITWLALLCSLTAKLVIGPNPDGIDIDVSYILIYGNGALFVGDHDCPYTDDLDIELFGRWVATTYRQFSIISECTSDRQMSQ